MTETNQNHSLTATWGPPSMFLGALCGLVVVLGFTVVHNVSISDIWFNIAPMLFAGAVCGLCIVWSYRKGVAEHSTAAWFRYAGLYAAEMIILGAVSLLVLRPRFTMAELMVADDAFERLLPPSMPLMIGAMAVGTAVIWIYYGRRLAALLPMLLTQVLLVFLLGHQFAFLGLVESSSALLVVFGEFALFTIGLGVVFCLGVMWSAMAVDRLRSHPQRDIARRASG
jgi:hypothetical protein